VLGQEVSLTRQTFLVYLISWSTVRRYILLIVVFSLTWFSCVVVFMGSEKYPDENDFDSFLKKHGGSSNAYTDCERVSAYKICFLLHNLIS
jgi:hypothetical protein